MSHYTVPGKGGFFELENEEELLLTPDMIPAPPKHLMADNPYSHHGKRYRQWKSCAIGRYYKSMYKELVTVKNKEDFLLKVGDARSALTDPNAWENYMEERELDVKRPVGRPRLPDAEKISRPPRAKRSDKMKVLLEQHGVIVNDDGTIEGYEDFTFLSNGRICTPEKDVISTIQFIHDYV